MFICRDKAILPPKQRTFVELLFISSKALAAFHSWCMNGFKFQCLWFQIHKANASLLLHLLYYPHCLLTHPPQLYHKHYQLLYQLTQFLLFAGCLRCPSFFSGGHYYMAFSLTLLTSLSPMPSCGSYVTLTADFNYYLHWSSVLQITLSCILISKKKCWTHAPNMCIHLLRNYHIIILKLRVNDKMLMEIEKDEAKMK